MNNRKKRTGTENIITNYESLASDAIQKLQTNIAFASPDNPIKVLAVTSSVQGEGKSSLVVNLANIYAFRGQKVCIVNFDLRRPSIHHFYNLQNKVGIVDYVNGDVDSIDALIKQTDKGVHVINSGSKTPFSTKILESNKLNPLFEELRKRYDIILVDTAPVLLVSDALLCSKYVDGFLFVCAQHVSKKKEVVNSIDTLRRNDIPVIGIVMTRVTEMSEIEGSKSYYYYSSDEKGSELHN